MPAFCYGILASTCAELPATRSENAIGDSGCCELAEGLRDVPLLRALDLW